MRVAYFTMEYPRATDTFIQREVAALRELGLDVSTVAARRPEEAHLVGREQREEAADTDYLFPAAFIGVLLAHVRLLAASPARYLSGLRLALATARPGLRGGLYQLFYFAEAGLLAARLRRSGADHVHGHFADVSTSVTMLAAHLADRPYSFTLHGPGVFFDANSWRLDEKIARASFVACISWFARSQAQLLSDEDAGGRLHIVHCGVEPARYRPISRTGDGLRLVFVGRLDHVKGLTVLLDAVAAVVAELEGLQLTVVGDGPHRAAFERHASKRGIEGIVDFVGYRSQDDVARLLADADAFVLPSFAEGVPVVLMEAAASELPVIATQVGGVSELVIDGETGLVVPPGDPAALADAIARLAHDRELRTGFGKRGRQVVVDEFDATVEAARLANLFLGNRGSIRPSSSIEHISS